MIRLLLDAIYSVLLFWACPYWLYKVPQARRYRAGLLQRLGFVPQLPSGEKRLWIHCASVGEASVPQKLVERFREQHPGWTVVFSTFTDTGAERLRKLYPDAMVFYWPLDLSCSVNRSLRRIQPDAVLLVEQELWPNFLLGCRESGIPVAIVNGRIRASSTRFVRGLGRICGPVFDPIKKCCARSEEDARRYRDAGLRESVVSVTGSLKYDALPTEIDTQEVADLRKLFGIKKDARVLVGGSTHPGEESILCEMWERLRGRHPDLRLILVPRHIERADDLQQELDAAGYQCVRKTALEEGAESQGSDSVILVDTIGDLVTCYGMASCVFVGRSLFPPGGGQNMMEPAALGLPVVVGPHTGNFDPEMQMLRNHDAVVEIGDPKELETKVRELLTDTARCEALGARARKAVMANKGAAEKTLKAVEWLL